MSVNGKVIANTPLAVDYWHVRKCPGARLFFLSHMHSDHTVGLTSTWSDRPIYCSATTGTLLTLKLQVKEQWIHPLELSEPYMLPLDDIGKEKLTVTLIEANHCPGAVMFLFEGYFGSILYTGDFRYTPCMLREPCLRTNTTIDVLYLDNTNCDPNRTLPSRQQATQQIKEIIRSHPNHCVVIGLYRLGKESLLLELAMEFKTWIEVSCERMETLRALQMPDVFTTDKGAGRIRVVDQTQICSAALQQWDREQPTLAILPTSRPLVSFHPNVHVVPYTDHSSYQELQDFVYALNPTSIVPIVGDKLPGSLSALLPKKRHQILVPESVRHYMSRQPENHLVSAAYTSLRRRHIQPLVPKGVVFESPVRALEAESLELDASEDENDTESSEDDSDCILIDLTKELTPNKNRRGGGDMWSLDIVQTVSEDVVMATTSSVPLSQVTQIDIGPVEILTNTKACLSSARTTRSLPESPAKIKRASNGNYSSLQSRHPNAQNNHTLSDGDSVRSQHSGRGVDQDSDKTSNDDNTSQHSGRGVDQGNGETSDYNNTSQHSGRGVDQDSDKTLNDDNTSQHSGRGVDQGDGQTSDYNNTSQHSGHRADQNEGATSLQRSLANNFSTSSRLRWEELENILLKNLPFTEEDRKSCGLLPRSFVEQFPLCPLYVVRQFDDSEE